MTSRIPYSGLSSANRERLERAYMITQPKTLDMLPRLTSVLRPIWQHVVSALAPFDGPRVRQICDADGSLKYFALDPVTGDRHLFESEEMLREWLASRYR